MNEKGISVRGWPREDVVFSESIYQSIYDNFNHCPMLANCYLVMSCAGETQRGKSEGVCA